jgi:hypothetical protein
MDRPAGVIAVPVLGFESIDVVEVELAELRVFPHRAWASVEQIENASDLGEIGSDTRCEHERHRVDWHAATDQRDVVMLGFVREDLCWMVSPSSHASHKSRLAQYQRSSPRPFRTKLAILNAPRRTTSCPLQRWHRARLAGAPTLR